jgi:LysM repeat protein
MNASETLLHQGQLKDAHLALSKLYQEQQLSPDQRQQVLDVLGRVAGTVVYSREHHYLNEPHQVADGDSLQQIAQQYQVTAALLAKINGIEGPLQAGQSLKVVQGPFRVQVDLQHSLMTVWLRNRYAGAFPIHLGPQPPPEGEYRVMSKTPAGDPSNQTEVSWISLDKEVHIGGLPDPSQIEQVPGSIGVNQRDAADLQAILSVGSPVTIRR